MTRFRASPHGEKLPASGGSGRLLAKYPAYRETRNAHINRKIQPIQGSRSWSSIAAGDGRGEGEEADKKKGLRTTEATRSPERNCFKQPTTSGDPIELEPPMAGEQRQVASVNIAVSVCISVGMARTRRVVIGRQNAEIHVVYETIIIKICED